MSGGFPLRAYEWHWRTVARTLAFLLVLAVMSGCSLFPHQAPAPIVDLSTPQPPVEPEVVEPEEPASTPVATLAPAEPKAPRPAPKRRVVVPKKPPPPPPPPIEEKAPPPPPPLLTTRIMQHEQIRGLLDSEIQRPDGKVIGRAVDMYADTTGKPKVMIVNLAGFLGIGDRKVTFPWSAFRFNPATKKAPITFAVPTPGSNPASNAASNAAKTKVQEATVKPGSVNDIAPTLAQLIDSNVSQKSGARMGRVVDVLIDSEAQPQALVIDLSDSLAADKRQVAANWPDLHVVSRNKVMQLQLDFTDAQIKAAPTYSPDQPIKIISPVVPPPEPAESPEPASAPAAAPAVAAAPAPASAPTAAAAGPGSGAKAGTAAVARPSKQ